MIPPSDLSVQPASEYNPAQLAEVFNRSFADYVVPIRVGPGFIHDGIRYDSLDVEASRVVLRQGREAGIGLIARRGWTSRVAAFAIEPDSRGGGVGRWFMTRLLEDAAARADRAMVLECIEQNAAGVGLYQKLGFTMQRRLVGYTATQVEGVADDALTEVDLSEVAQAVACYDDSDLPWQIAAATLAQMTPPGRGYRLGPAYAALTDPDRPQVLLKTLVVRPEARRQGWATRLLRAVAARHPGEMWKVSVHVPEETAPGLFAKLGFEREALTQLQMRRVL